MDNQSATGETVATRLCIELCYNRSDAALSSFEDFPDDFTNLLLMKGPSQRALTKYYRQSKMYASWKAWCN